jgi:hypothetical protein
VPAATTRIGDTVECMDDAGDRGDLAGDADESIIRNALPSWLESWRRRSATGAVLTGIAFGVRDALEPERDSPAIVVPAPGPPPGPQPLELHLGDDRPEEAWAVVRPWLVTHHAEDPVDTGPQGEARSGNLASPAEGGGEQTR